MDEPSELQDNETARPETDRCGTDLSETAVKGARSLREPLRSRGRLGLRTALAFAAVLAAPGCEQIAALSPAEPSTPVVAEPSPVLKMMADAARDAERALDSLARVEQARAPAPPPSQPVAGLPSELAQPIGMNFIGPIDVAVAELARKAGYELRILGDQPPTPILVDISAEGLPLWKAVESAGLQAGQRADVVISMRERVIEVRYAG